MVKYLLKSGVEIYMDQTLMYQLDSLVYNVKDDWDFVIVITGDRMVRTGKSVFAMQIGAYLADRLNTSFELRNINFDSQDMIHFAQESKQNTIVIYDEGREGLAANKSSKQLQKDLLDYFAEVGQLNHIFIIVLPDFFELKENMAVARSEMLINVWRASQEKMLDIYKEGKKIPIVKFQRGFFEFFSRKKKSLLFDKFKQTQRKNYQLVKPNFKGRFVNKYTVDEQEYRAKKKEALSRFEERKKQEKVAKTDIFRDNYIWNLYQDRMKHTEIVRKLEDDYGYSISSRRIGQIIQKRLESAQN